MKIKVSDSSEIYHIFVVLNCYWGFKMRIKMSFMVLELWLFGCGKVLEEF